MLDLTSCQKHGNKPSKGTLLDNLLQGVTFYSSLVLAVQMKKHTVKGPKL